MKCTVSMGSLFLGEPIVEKENGMRRLTYSLVIFILIGGIVLTAYAPDEISMVFIVLMEGIVFMGVLLGIVRVIQYYRGFDYGIENIDRALDVQTSSTWSVLAQNDDFFTSEPWMGCSESIRRRFRLSGNPARCWLTSVTLLMMMYWG